MPARAGRPGGIAHLKAKASGNAAAVATDKARIAGDEHGLNAAEQARASARCHEGRTSRASIERPLRTERWQRDRDECDAVRDERPAAGAEAAADRASNAIGHDESVRDALHRDWRSDQRLAGSAWCAGRADWRNREANRQERRAGVHLEDGERRDVGADERRDVGADVRRDAAALRERNAEHRNHRA